MIADFEILGKFYELLNVSSITDIIDGEIWKIVKPVGREFEDIVINTLTNENSNNGHLNTGVVNINSFTFETAGHTPDTLRMQTINNVIIAALNMQFGEGNFERLNFRIISQKTFRDNDNPLMFFSNLKISYSFKN